MSDVGVAENHVATVRSNEAHDHVERCGFASAVRPQQSNDFSGADIHVDAIYDGTAAVDFDKLVGG